MTFSEKEIQSIIKLTETWAAGQTPQLRSKRVKSWWELHRPDTFQPNHDLPAAALFEILKPAFEESQGFSISKHFAWETLNIYPATSRHHTERDINAMQQTLVRLHNAGLIEFQYAGNIWRIDI